MADLSVAAVVIAAMIIFRDDIKNWITRGHNDRSQ